MKTLLFLVMLVPLFLVSYPYYQVNHFSSDWASQEPGDCLLILGSKVRENHQPDVMMRERVKTAASILSEQTTAIIATGGSQDDKPSEAEVIQRELVERGVDEDLIHLETSSTSTYQNLLYSKPIVEELDCEQLDFLSNDFHLARVKMTAERMELPVNRLIPANKDRPNSRERLAREYVAYLAYWLLWDHLES